MEQASKAVAALHPPGRERDHVGRLAGSALLQPLVRPGVVVVLDELAQHLSRCPRPKMRRWSSTSRRQVPTNLSAIEFATGLR